MEPYEGIGPSTIRWQRNILPLNYYDMEPYDGAAPPLSVWKTDVPAAIRVRHLRNHYDYGVFVYEYI